MNLVQTLYLLAFLALGVVLAVRLPHESRTATAGTVGELYLWVAGLILALLCVGVVSRTLVRHVVQVLPAVIALMLIIRRSPQWTVAAVPLFTFSLGIMVNIWLFLLGVAHIFGGSFTRTEVTLTMIIGLVCILGIVATVRRAVRLTIEARFATAIVFSVLQFAALWLSVQRLAIFR